MPALGSVPASFLAPPGLPPIWSGPDLLAYYGVVRGPEGRLLWHDPQRLCERLLAGNSGDRRWKGCKQANLEDVLTLTQQTDRVKLVGGSLHGDLSLVIALQTPVPRRPQEGRLRIGDLVLLHVAYQSAWLTEPPHPQAPVGVMTPLDVFLPNASPLPGAALCLGHLPAGVPVLELVHLAYLALSVQTVMLNEVEGVMNPAASDWFREHDHFQPLTRTGLLEPWSPDDLTLHDALFEPEGGAQ